MKPQRAFAEKFGLRRFFSTKIYYFVATLRLVANDALFDRLGAKKGLCGTTTVLLGQVARSWVGLG